MRFSLRLPRRQAWLVALTVAYHLARPGPELAEAVRVGAYGRASLRKCIMGTR